MPTHHAIVLNEWSDFSVKLGGPSVRILCANFQAISSTESVDVTQLLQKDLRLNGFVWLSTWGLPDPARWKRKRLLVIYSGENDCKSSSALWSAASFFTVSLALKGPLSSLGSDALHAVPLDCAALVLPVAAVGVVAYTQRGGMG
ncbi:unnamed protein product, partial [Effrenium voratum]